MTTIGRMPIVNPGEVHYQREVNKQFEETAPNLAKFTKSSDRQGFLGAVASGSIQGDTGEIAALKNAYENWANAALLGKERASITAKEVTASHLGGIRRFAEALENDYHNFSAKLVQTNKNLITALEKVNQAGSVSEMKTAFIGLKAAYENYKNLNLDGMDEIAFTGEDSNLYTFKQIIKGVDNVLSNRSSIIDEDLGFLQNGANELISSLKAHGAQAVSNLEEVRANFQELQNLSRDLEREFTTNGKIEDSPFNSFIEKIEDLIPYALHHSTEHLSPFFKPVEGGWSGGVSLPSTAEIEDAARRAIQGMNISGEVDEETLKAAVQAAIDAKLAPLQDKVQEYEAEANKLSDLVNKLQARVGAQEIKIPTEKIKDLKNKLKTECSLEDSAIDFIGADGVVDFTKFAAAYGKIPQEKKEKAKEVLTAAGIGHLIGADGNVVTTPPASDTNPNFDAQIKAGIKEAMGFWQNYGVPGLAIVALLGVLYNLFANSQADKKTKAQMEGVLSQLKPFLEMISTQVQASQAQLADLTQVAKVTQDRLTTQGKAIRLALQSSQYNDNGEVMNKDDEGGDDVVATEDKKTEGSLVETAKAGLKEDEALLKMPINRQPAGSANNISPFSRKSDSSDQQNQPPTSQSGASQAPPQQSGGMQPLAPGQSPFAQQGLTSAAPGVVAGYGNLPQGMQPLAAGQNPNVFASAPQFVPVGGAGGMLPGQGGVYRITYDLSGGDHKDKQ